MDAGSSEMFGFGSQNAVILETFFFFCVLLYEDLYLHCTTSSGRVHFCLLGYNTVQSVESQPTFQRNIAPSASGSKNKSNQ
jgi:hypothetical protein